ncbi:MAG: c-type cytochrome domain-containing protein [Planctomycetota bacterium]|jgi:uncharacterized membrane protein
MLKHFMDAWADPSMRHAMVVHFPIVLALAGIPFVVIAALIQRRGAPMRWTALAVYLLLAVIGMAGRASGHDAHDAVSGSLNEQGQALLEDHERLGHQVWLFGALVAGLIGASFWKKPKVRVPAAWLAVAGSLLAAGWTANTANHGGRLVYEHGAGTPDELANILAATAASDRTTMDRRVSHFREQIRPILVNNCLRCHNAKRARQAGNLDLTTISGLLRGGMSGAAVVPGKPEEKIAALHRWITDGAVWERFDYEAARRMQD